MFLVKGQPNGSLQNKKKEKKTIKTFVPCDAP
jgi:hypothetical protein